MDSKTAGRGAPAWKEAPDATPSGFQGAIGSLPLVDLLQVWSLNGFSGLITVTSLAIVGRIYFVDGAIVHAEAGAQVGEAAVATIIGWPQGSFELYPNTATLSRTIEKSVSHLLLDAHRVLDEQRRNAPPAPAASPAAAAPPGAAAPPTSAARRSSTGLPAATAAGGRTVLDQVRAIPGVLRAVRFGPDGRPVNEPSPEAEDLAAKGLYLALQPAAAVAQAFGLQGLSIAALHSARLSFVLVHSASQYLCVAVDPAVPLDPVLAQVRALLTRPAAR